MHTRHTHVRFLFLSFYLFLRRNPRVCYEDDDRMTVLFMNLLFFLRIKLRIPLGRVLLQVRTLSYSTALHEQEARARGPAG